MDQGRQYFRLQSAGEVHGVHGDFVAGLRCATDETARGVVAVDARAVSLNRQEAARNSRIEELDVEVAKSALQRLVDFPGRSSGGTGLHNTRGVLDCKECASWVGKV